MGGSIPDGDLGRSRSLEPCLNLFRISPEGMVIGSGRAIIDRFPFCHDYALTEHYAVFFIGSIVFEGMGRFFLGMDSIADRIGFDDQLPMKVVVVDVNTSPGNYPEAYAAVGKDIVEVFTDTLLGCAGIGA